VLLIMQFLRLARSENLVEVNFLPHQSESTNFQHTRRRFVGLDVPIKWHAGAIYDVRIIVEDLGNK